MPVLESTKKTLPIGAMVVVVVKVSKMLTLDGKLLAQEREAQQQKKIASLQMSCPPGLAVLLVGQDPASHTYVQKKKQLCKRLGVEFFLYEWPHAKIEKLARCIRELNTNRCVHGILLQLPVAGVADVYPLLSLIAPHKDIDALGPYHSARLFRSAPGALAPCTPRACLSLLRHYGLSCKTHAVVVGRSPLVGLPLFMLLQQHGATVSLCHSQTPDLGTYTKKASLVAVATGQKHLLGKEHFQKSAVVLDIGINKDPVTQKLHGDVNPQGLAEHLKAFSPVPGGVGPMTLSLLIDNLTHLCTSKFNQ